MSSKNNSFNLSHLVGGKRLIKEALREDIGCGDITTQMLIPKDKKIKAVLLLKEKAVVAGIDIAKKVFKTMDAAVTFKAKCSDGSLQNPGKIIAILEGRAKAILQAERTALNFLSHLSGVATLTHQFVQRVKPYKVKIMDTRKTIPGLRELQKYAVSVGGGYNHRMGLWDGVLIKDNHIVASSVVRSPSSVEELVEMAKKRRPKSQKIEIEVKNLQEFRQALRAETDIIMLDNMKLSDIRQAVRIRNTEYGRRTTKIEVSGGVTLDNVRAIAKTGVDMISIGALTHSAKAIDLSLEVLD